MNYSADRAALILRAFEQIQGGAPAVVARAPGRVDLMGSHTDYNLGFVLTLPISLDTWIAARLRCDGQVRVYSLNLDSQICFQIGSIRPDNCFPWGNYIRGVAAVLQDEGLKIRGFDAVIHSLIPIGSGLGSSAALECATAVVCQHLNGWRIEAARMAQLCQRAENQFVGVGCGILDQYTSCLGRESCALVLDCRDLSTRPVMVHSDIRVVVCDTRSPRTLAGSEYGARRATCEEAATRLGVAALREATLSQLEKRASDWPAEMRKRARFIIEENERVPRLAVALAANDSQAIREVCSESYRGAAELYEICSPAMHQMMRAMLCAPGVIGARQAGAGFGGCMVAFVHAEATEAFSAAVAAAYRSAAGLAPGIHPVEAAAGAGLIAFD